MVDPAADRILVTVQGTTAYIRVVGRGSFKISTSLKEFGRAAIERGCRYLALDMADCVGMDSTFMGVLAGLAMDLKRRGGGRIVMVNLSIRTRGLLGTLGLDQVIEPHMTGSMPDDLKAAFGGGGPAMAPVAGEEESQRSTAETMLEAHENLVALSPENLPKFKDVLTFLREDLKNLNSNNKPV